MYTFTLINKVTPYYPPVPLIIIPLLLRPIMLIIIVNLNWFNEILRFVMNLNEIK